MLLSMVAHVCDLSTHKMKPESQEFKASAMWAYLKQQQTKH